MDPVTDYPDPVAEDEEDEHDEYDPPDPEELRDIEEYYHDDYTPGNIVDEPY